MILKAKHLYKITLPNALNKRKYVLIAPKTDFDVDNLYDGYGFYISCIACIDVKDDFFSNTSLFFSSKRNCIFENPTTSDIIEMTRKMKENGDNFIYDFKSGEIKRKKQVFEL
jgi:hypothetical protein